MMCTVIPDDEFTPKGFDPEGPVGRIMHLNKDGSKKAPPTVSGPPGPKPPPPSQVKNHPALRKRGRRRR